MAVKQIFGKKITKIDPRNPNYILPDEEVEEISGNMVEQEDVYGEKKYYYRPEPNGNLQMEQMMGKILNKLDNVGTDDKSQTGVAPIEVDIKREISISKVDTSAVKSQEFKGKVKNKKNKLKALRHKKMYQKQMGNK